MYDGNDIMTMPWAITAIPQDMGKLKREFNIGRKQGSTRKRENVIHILLNGLNGFQYIWAYS